MKKLAACSLWLALAFAGVWAVIKMAAPRGQAVNSVYILIAAVCAYAIGYRFYSKWIAARVLMLDDRRATPCEARDDGRDFVRTNKWIVFGHHFAAISGPGPLVGPVLAAQFGYLPGTLWILIGVVLGGAVQDFVVLFASMRRNGKSLGQMVKEELNTTAGYIAMVAIVGILIILLAVLALVVVNALAESPWGVFTVGATIPIALLMGGYLRFWRVGRVVEASALGVALLLLAVWGGQFAQSHEGLRQWLTFGPKPLAWVIIFYGVLASVLPIWLLLAPRDYLSTFMKLGTIFALACGIFLVLPELKMPALSRFVDGSGPVVPGKVFPFCFITIACGAVSGFHSLIASGTTPKLLTRESYARSIGYGAMCCESLVAIMALIAACALDPGVYLSMNIKGAPEATVAKVSAWGFPVTTEEMAQLAKQSGEETLFGRTGGAATLAVGMSRIFSRVVNGRGLDLWYHFAIMFEALFILTTLDAGTRVGRYILQDALGNIWKPLGDTKRMSANIVASVLVVAGWGYFLIQGVLDPDGGVKALWPLFGIANQMLAAIALCLATTILLKMQLAGKTAELETRGSPSPHSFVAGRGSRINSSGVIQGARLANPALALVALIPLIWLLAVTMTAGYQKILDPDARIGFLASNRVLDDKLAALQIAGATSAKAVSENRTLHFNNQVDAVVTGFFLVMVAIVVLVSVREWIMLLTRRREATLHETEPVWLPACAVVESRPTQVLGIVALGCALAKELSGEVQMDRAREAAVVCQCGHDGAEHLVAHGESAAARERIYLEMTEKRFNGINRCC